MTVLVEDDAARNVRELRDWLQSHPKQKGTPQYRDREISLERWLRHQERVAAVAEAAAAQRRALLARAGQSGDWTKPRPR